MRLPIGIDDFGKIIDQQLDFVDKSLFIKSILDDNGVEVAVITRPRRFGKTLNQSMLQYFLSPEVLGRPSKGMFDNLKIGQHPECMKHQGQYPVVFISLKSVKDHSFEHSYANLCKLMSDVYSEHTILLSSSKLSDQQKISFELILSKKADVSDMTSSLKDLTKYLFLHYGVKPYLLIDEYDTPIQDSYLHGYYDQMINLMRGLLGDALKTNPYLEKGIITGILRISKESLFSGLNNLKVYSILNKRYGEYFGFTETEVDELLQKAQLNTKAAEIKHWYNGYLMGDTTIYNPWSIVNCLNDHGILQKYWVNTSGNELIKKLLAQSDELIKEQLESILRGEAIEAIVEENLVYGELEKNANALWGLLLFSGYLKVVASEPAVTGMLCKLMSPNYEISQLYSGIVTNWFSESMGDLRYQQLLKNLISGNIEDFGNALQRYLLQSMSYFDVSGTQPEKFYHGFVMGLLVNLEKTHEIKSNRESGYGRYDVLIIPHDKTKLGIIIEFKTAQPNDDLSESAKSALAQINKRQYVAEMLQFKVKNILKLGMAFKGKQVMILQEIVE